MSCDMFYYMLPDRSACVFSWFRIAVFVSLIVVAIAVCVSFVPEDDVPQRPRPKRKDDAQVVRKEEPVELRRRGSAVRPDESPPRGATAKPAGAYPLLPGYSGIEITPTFSSGQQR